MGHGLLISGLDNVPMTWFCQCSKLKKTFFFFFWYLFLTIKNFKVTAFVTHVIHLFISFNTINFMSMKSIDSFQQPYKNVLALVLKCLEMYIKVLLWLIRNL